MRLHKFIPLLLILFSNNVFGAFSADSTPMNDAVANLDDNKVNTVAVPEQQHQVSTVPYYLITDKGDRKTQGPWVHDEHNKAPQNLVHETAS